ncbi:probable transcription factor At1g61730 [Cynara cardunculus var. scolymus]|uniref:probable transcription factor At1g61730 n=1 Tax=Cynara cardunculus var. scolymus TaxID=59895 RepID=UPI000D62BC97|nr:probable transcription factor At1g61730 [Cynara cardunculus var. scolymus]
MADPLHSPPDPKPPTPAAGKSSTKRKNAAAAAACLANKRPNRDPPSTTTTTADVEHATTSKRKEIGQDVDLDDIEVLESILDYHSKKGVFPFDNPTAMKNFLYPWLIFHIGNKDVWKTKLEQVKTKFTKESDPIEDGDRKEFELWMKIWGNEGGDDHDPSVGF